ncbi:SdpI family protein [Paenibacillus harenae]|uniref:SdpI family protein n=1 Tax=Paenibacillus harenae TaxID=306543 RepID=UPI0027934392|nr:SdpI family protein [Paenibacillus harenae]MDQ0058030.1 putative membrane protein [Paenibacillus harenae]
MNIKRLTWLIVGAAFIASAIVYRDMPGQMPVHWNANNEIDNYAHKAVALFLLPAIMLLLNAMQSVLPKIDPRRSNYAPFQSSLDIIRLITTLGLLVIHGYTIAVGYGYTFSITYVVLPFLGLLFLATGNYMPRFQYNSYVGIKTPHTLANEHVWRKTHQSAAKLFVIGGLMIIASLVLPVPIQSYIIIAIIIAVVAASYGLGFYFSRKTIK